MFNFVVRKSIFEVGNGGGHIGATGPFGGWGTAPVNDAGVMGADADGMGAGVMGADAGVMGAAADAEALSVAS